jgi:class II aldolase/adducin N-terminal domain-containing protein
LPEAVRKYVKAHDGMLLANHGALTLGADVFSAYYKMETIEHFAKISLVARLLGGERLLSREEVGRLEKLRGSYGIASPAPICADPLSPLVADALDCQIVQSPVSASGERLVPDGASRDGEIRLTYSELTALIEDAVKSLR